jgi:CheY-like chemotaxis protein
VHVLIIEDIGYSSAIVEKFLKSRHYHYTTATNGHDALEVLANGPVIDVVICDLSLPDMDGIEIFQVCQKLLKYKRQNSQPPFILLTANTNPKELQRAENAGFTAVFSKPFNAVAMAEILSAIDGGQGYIQKDVDKSRIILVDTQGKNQELLQEVFANSGYKLMLSSSPTHCLGMMKELTGIKAIITDLEFPDMDANTMMAEVQKLSFSHGKPVCILLTESKNVDLLQMAYLSGFDDVLTHPIDKFNLKQKINQAFLGQSKKQNELDTVLIVDDVFFYCAMAKSLLLKAGLDTSKYQIKMVQSGYDAFDMIKTDNQIKLVLTDLALKDIGGYDLLNMYQEQFQKSRSKHPVFALMTATDNFNELEAYRDKGFAEVFQKPLDIEALQSFLKEQLGCSAHVD